MKIVPFYLELASDEQQLKVEKALNDLKVSFIVSETYEGITLEDVERFCNLSKSEGKTI